MLGNCAELSKSDSENPAGMMILVTVMTNLMIEQVIDWLIERLIDQMADLAVEERGA